MYLMMKIKKVGTGKPKSIFAKAKSFSPIYCNVCMGQSTNMKKWAKSGTLHSAKAALMGGAFGVCAAYIVTHSLLEVSFNKYFCVLFALGCFLLGGVVAQRAATLPESNENRTKQLLRGFAGMLVLAGLFSFFVEKQWFTSLPAMAKVPMYSFIGIALTFALSFACVDCANFIVEVLGGSKRVVPIRNGRQVLVIIIVSIVVGALFGLFFGTLDVEDKVDIKLRQDKFLCVPISAAISSVAAVFVEKFGNKTYQPAYGLVPQDDDDEDDFFFGGDP
eukprot:GHVO01051069.1.p2 GENE.GHVO01051069.1~~GHVO01051069.1.p2  ORF type:complete len:276 (+),score=22.16 GHVO01051069.1:625-1452(+)